MDIDSTLFNCVIDITVVCFMWKVKTFHKDYKQCYNAFKVYRIFYFNLQGITGQFSTRGGFAC